MQMFIGDPEALLPKKSEKENDFARSSNWPGGAKCGNA